MKIKILGRAMEDPEIQFVSLVKRGANREPFRILKAENVEVPESGTTLRDKVLALFSKADAPKVTALFVDKEELDKVLPVLKSAGFRDDLRTEGDHIVCLKQVEGDDIVAGSFVQVSPGVVAGLNVVRKGIGFWNSPVPATGPEPYKLRTFDEIISETSIYPMFDGARSALWTALDSALQAPGTKEETLEAVATATRQFTAYVQNHLSDVPEELFKCERSFAVNLEGRNLSTNASSAIGAKDGDSMDKKLREAVPGDLEDLLVHKSEDQNANPPADENAPVEVKKCEKCEAVLKDGVPCESPECVAARKSEEDAAAEAAAAEAVAKAQYEADAAEAARKLIKTGTLKVKEGDAEVTKTYEYRLEDGKPVFVKWVTPESEPAPTAKTDDKPEAASTGKDSELMTVVTALAEQVAKTNEAIAELQKGQVAKAEDSKPVVRVSPVVFDYDESLAHGGGRADRRRVAKSAGADNVWAGLIPAFDALERGEASLADDEDED